MPMPLDADADAESDFYRLHINLCVFVCVLRSRKNFCGNFG